MKQQPGAQAQMDHTRAPKRKQGEWVQKNLVRSGNNCDCSGTCWLAWCCSPCLLQRNYNRYKYIADDESNEYSDSKYGWCCALQCVTWGWGHYILPTAVRNKIREERHVNGNIFGDFCATACCLPCSLIQESHEMDSAVQAKRGNAKH